MAVQLFINSLFIVQSELPTRISDVADYETDDGMPKVDVSNNDFKLGIFKVNGRPKPQACKKNRWQ